MITTKGKDSNKQKDKVKYHSPGNLMQLEISFQAMVIFFLPNTKMFWGNDCWLAAQNEQIIGITPAMLRALPLMMIISPIVLLMLALLNSTWLYLQGDHTGNGALLYDLFHLFTKSLWSGYLRCCFQNLPVISVDRAGLVGEDGATHHGIFDLTYKSDSQYDCFCAAEWNGASQYHVHRTTRFGSSNCYSLS